MLIVGDSPQSLPIGTFLIFHEELEEWMQTEFDIQKAAIEQALFEFWAELNR